MNSVRLGRKKSTHPDWQRCRRIIPGIAGDLPQAEFQQVFLWWLPKGQAL